MNLNSKVKYQTHQVYCSEYDLYEKMEKTVTYVVTVKNCALWPDNFGKRLRTRFLSEPRAKSCWWFQLPTTRKTAILRLLEPKFWEKIDHTGKATARLIFEQKILSL